MPRHRAPDTSPATPEQRRAELARELAVVDQDRRTARQATRQTAEPQPARYRAVWPVVDDTLPLRDLFALAEPDLAGLLLRARLRPAGRGPVRWSVRQGKDVPGSGGAVLVVVADCAVAPIPADVDTITGQRDRPCPANTKAARAARAARAAAGEVAS